MPPLILVFNVYITRRPRYEGLNFQNRVDQYLRLVRNVGTVYREVSKLEICCYTLQSLSRIAWDHSILNIDIGEGYTESDKQLILHEARKIFPYAEISGTRAHTRVQYINIFESIKKRFATALIFFSPNHDHVFTGTDPSLIRHAANYLELIRTNTKAVTRVCYSHQLEQILALRNGSPIFGMYLLGGSIIKEDDEFIVAQRDRMAWDSYYISHIDDLLSYYYFSSNDGYCPRGEDLYDYPFPPTRNIVIIPKRKLCDHFDGYSHVYGHEVFDNFENRFAMRVPPLFIPYGFFEKAIKIRYGYSTTREGWVNIYPDRGDYSCHFPGSMDMRCTLDQIPLFWTDHISEIDINKVLHSKKFESHSFPLNVEDQSPFYDMEPIYYNLQKFGIDPFSKFKYAENGNFSESLLRWNRIS